MGIDGKEWGGPLASGFNGAIVDAELKFPGLAAAVGVKGPTSFAIQAKIGIPIKTYAQYHGFADVVDPIEGVISDQEFVAQM